MAHLDLDAAVDRLYGAAPESFVGERKRLAAEARADGDRRLATQILALRKPTLSAWAINVTVRAEPSQIGDLDGFAERMRAAQSSSDGAAMRALGREREPLLTRLEQAVVARAGQDGQTWTAAVLAEVRSTFVAAIADPAAADRALSGRLLRALAYAGLGEVDLTAATAGPVPARGAGPTQQRGRAAQDAEPCEQDARITATTAGPEPAPGAGPAQKNGRAPQDAAPSEQDARITATTAGPEPAPGAGPAQKTGTTPQDAAPPEQDARITAATAGPVPGRGAGPAQQRGRAPQDAEPSEQDARITAATAGPVPARGAGPTQQTGTTPQDAEPSEQDARVAARRRLRSRARDRLAEAEREVTARSLAGAQAREQADRASARVAELERLLRRTTFEAATALEVARQADAALAEALDARREAAAEVDALTE